MKILAIETSCDETAIALIKASGGLKHPKFKIIKNLVASQIKIHQPYGGVVPNLAKREHLKNLPLLWEKIKEHKLKIKNKKNKIYNSKFIIPDIIAVTVGPGLEPALWTGINFAREVYQELKSKNKKLKIRLMGVNHLDGHLYSFLLNPKQKIKFPAIALIVSGGHTMLIKMDSLTKLKVLGETLDDAVGEAFDKVARILNLPYPGGPEIEKLASKGKAEAIKFPRPMINQKNYNFSYSGLKTSVLYFLRDHQNELKSNNLKFKADIAASFQKAAFEVLIKKTMRAAEEFKAQSIIISGGVAANKTLAKEFKKAVQQRLKLKQKTKNKKSNSKYQLLITKYPTDNAAMIAAAAYINYLRKKQCHLIANGNLDI